MKPKNKKIKGQDTIEFIAVFPAFLFIIGALIVLAVQWHGFHVTANTALEAGSLSGGGNPMLASWDARNVAEKEYANGGIYVQYDVTNNVSEASIGEFFGFKADGTAPGISNLINYSLLGPRNTQGYVQVPEWIFKPCGERCSN